MAEAEKAKRSLTGKVVSNKMDKAIVVLVERRVKHKLYPKIITRSKKIHAFDESNDCSMGDIVKIIETTPRTKTISWALAEIVEKAR